MRSRTPVADAIQDQVIEVYMAWRSGRLGKGTVEVTRRLDTMEKRLDAQEAVLGQLTSNFETLLKFACESRRILGYVLDKLGLDEEGRPEAKQLVDAPIGRHEALELKKLIWATARANGVSFNDIEQLLRNGFDYYIPSYRNLRRSQIERAEEILIAEQKNPSVTPDGRTQEERDGYDIAMGRRRPRKVKKTKSTMGEPEKNPHDIN
jgi:hypothetical protein